MFNDAVEIIIDVRGYPRWMARIEVELMLLSAYAARERLRALGYTQLTLSAEDVHTVGTSS